MSFFLRQKMKEKKNVSEKVWKDMGFPSVL